MSRLVAMALGVIVLGALPAPAQPLGTLPTGRMSGGFRPTTPTLLPLTRDRTGAVYGTGSRGFATGARGYRPYYWGGLGGYYPYGSYTGGLFPYGSMYNYAGLYGAGYAYGSYLYPPYAEAVPVPVPVVVGPAAPPPPVVELSGQLPATLTLEFPAAATVWLDGAEVPGEAAAVRTLTSPAIRAGGTYTFRVRARWTANGQTYEATREVALGPGERSRLLVVSGTALSEK